MRGAEYRQTGDQDNIITGGDMRMPVTNSFANAALGAVAYDSVTDPAGRYDAIAIVVQAVGCAS